MDTSNKKIKTDDIPVEQNKKDEAAIFAEMAGKSCAPFGFKLTGFACVYFYEPDTVFSESPTLTQACQIRLRGVNEVHASHGIRELEERMNHVYKRKK